MIVDALLKPEAYPHKVERVELIQTHISFVFLTGEYVYKVKKPVDFGFLDFTTLEKRKFYCEEEIRVNKAMAGDIYLGVVPITEEDGKIRVEGGGRVVEYAVKMVQLPQQAIMSKMLSRGDVHSKDIEDISRIVADFHSKANRGKEIDRYGSYEQVVANWEQNFEQTVNLKGKYVDEEEFEKLKAKVMGFLRENRKLFDRRVEQGKIRECHGDLHSGNIFIVREAGKLYKKGIYIFDAIEFFKGFSCSDILADIAFLAMDLDFHGRGDFAELFVKRYLEFSGEKSEPELLNFYKCYRAYVRMKVNGFKLFDENVGEEEKQECAHLVSEYFSLASAYAEQF